METLPLNHFKSLSLVEATYWWHCSRAIWAEYLIRNFFDRPSELKVLDYGCGTGGFLHALDQRFLFRGKLGLDISPQAIQMAANYGPHYRLHQGGFHSAMGEADLVFMMDVLEHISDDGNFLVKMMEYLKPKTRLLLSVPALPFLFSSWDTLLGHYRRYTKKSLNRLIRASGGRTLYVGYSFGFCVPLIVLKRLLTNRRSSKDNCEFPPVSPFMNSLFIRLNQLEMFSARFLPLPFGSSVFCLAEKT